MANVANPIQVQKFLKGVNYPVSREGERPNATSAMKHHEEWCRAFRAVVRGHVDQTIARMVVSKSLQSECRRSARLVWSRGQNAPIARRPVLFDGRLRVTPSTAPSSFGEALHCIEHANAKSIPGLRCPG